MSGRYRLAGTLFASRCDQSALPQSRTQRAGRANGNTQERYGYDAGGARVRKTSGGTTTYTFFAHYEEEATNGATTAISHYSFGGLRIAVKRGSTLCHVHGDHLGSTSLTMSAAGWEHWAKAVTDWVYGLYYQQRQAYNSPRSRINQDQIDSIEEILMP